MQQNDPGKLKHGDDELEDNPCEEWSERSDEDHVVQLQERRCDRQGPEQIETNRV